ncbi:MAG TPA: hypothetical protein VGO53_06305 [Steroidobacteraceae bacterium]|nr:hypothetical protein [Steroidobacteraceae bacterium]
MNSIEKMNEFILAARRLSFLFLPGRPAMEGFWICPDEEALNRRAAKRAR